MRVAWYGEHVRAPGIAVAVAGLIGALAARGRSDEPAPVPQIPVVTEGRARYVGAGACGACHPDELRAWRAGPHARRAAATLGDAVSRRACQTCHTTGDAPVGPAVFDDVQCEACHGPGVGYSPDDVMRDPALARALGLRDLSTPALRAALCAGCHRDALKLAPFDPVAAWQRIGHGRARE